MSEENEVIEMVFVGTNRDKTELGKTIVQLEQAFNNLGYPATIVVTDKHLMIDLIGTNSYEIMLSQEADGARLKIDR